MPRIFYQATVPDSGVYFPIIPGTTNWLNISVYNSIGYGLKTDAAGTITIEFSPDESNVDSIVTQSIASATREVHIFKRLNSFCRFKWTPTGNQPSYFRMEIFNDNFSSLTSTLNSTIQSDADAQVTRSVLMGATDRGDYFNVPVTPEGHLEVAVHDPILPFGSLHTEQLTPIFQFDAVYGLNTQLQESTTSGTGTATGTNGMMTVTTGTTSLSQGVIQSRKRLRYRAGQGVVARFTTLFTTPVANSYQLAGIGHAESGVYVGYGNTNDLSDTRFGILHVTGGVREIKTLTVTGGASSSGNVTITLNGTAFTAAVTNSSNIQRTVYEISQGTYAGWTAYPSGATVIFLRSAAGTTAGTQSFSAGTTGSAASIAQTRAGAASTDTFYPQAEWNGDKLDGTGASGVTIDPTKLNIWQIGVGYLGTDALVVKAKVTPASGNNSIWNIVHTIRFPNTRTTPIFSNPAFPFTLAAYSAGSTTDLTVKSASVGGFIEGQKVLHGNRFTYFNQLTTVGAANLQALFTIMNARVYQSVTNQSVINMLNASGAIKHTSPVIFYLIRNGTLAGNPNFQSLASNSSSLWDTAATTVTYATGNQLLATFHVGDTGEFDHHFGNGQFNAEELTIQPGEWITLAAKSTTGSPAYVTGSINTREDQ